MGWFDHILFWHWWILAGILLILELTLPAFFFLWLGIAAAATGLIMLVFPNLPLETQLIIFSVLSVIAVLAWRRYREAHPVVTDQPNLNRRGRQYVGRVFTLKEPVVNGVGKVTVDDSTWRVRGPDLPAGTRVRVTDVDGVTFIIGTDQA
jgi:membrane protein implicated in regulation of membrane protease activity